MEYYVSPAPVGSDTHGTGSASSPFQTIDFAASKATQSGDVVVIRQGVYRETVRSISDNVTFQSYPGESVIVSGLDPVTTPWNVVSGSIYQTGPISSLGPGLDQLFVDGQMMIRARWPNTPVSDVFTCPNYACAAAGNAEPPTGRVPCPPNNPDYWICNQVIQVDASYQLPADLTGYTIQISLGHHWWWQTGTVQSASGNTLTFQFDEYGGINAATTFAGNPTENYFFLEGAGELDAPGEWWLDGAGTLSLWTPGGDSPAHHVVEYKVRQYAFDLSGTQNITIQDVKIFGAGVYTDPSTTGLLLDNLNAQYVYHNTVISDPWSAGVGDSGLILDGSNNILQKSVIAYSSANGVTLLGQNNCVLSSVIHGTDYAGSDAAAIATGLPSATSPPAGAAIEYNTIYNTWRSGIQHRALLSGAIRYNHVYRAGLQTYDQGLTYTAASTSGTPGPVTQTEIAYNLLHGDTGHLGHGVYLDNDSSGYVVHHNVIWNVDAGIALNGQGTYNAIYNNTVAIDNAAIPGGVSVSAHAPVGSPGQTSTLISNNIFQPSADLTAFATSANRVEQNYQIDASQEGSNPAEFVDPGAHNYQVQPASPVLGVGYDVPVSSYAFPGTTTTYTSSHYAGACDGVASPGSVTRPRRSDST